MDAPVNTRQTDPHVNPALSTQEIELVARADERLAHAYQQIARADEELARFNEQISKLENKPVNRLRQPSRGRPALRGLMGLLLTAGICAAAFVWQSHGEAIRPIISQWAPQLVAASSLPSEAPKLADQQSPPAVQLAAEDAAASQSPPPAQTAAQDAAAASVAAEQAQLLQTMARDLASVQQEIEQLKAGQAELTRENARTAEQFKANQEQMARAIASATEQSQRPRTSAAPLPAARKPVPTRQTEARVQARAPVQLQPR
jgi:septal ring factor EnvC (AmiA/AmiB activator)